MTKTINQLIASDVPKYTIYNRQSKVLIAKRKSHQASDVCCCTDGVI